MKNIRIYSTVFSIFALFAGSCSDLQDAIANGPGHKLDPLPEKTNDLYWNLPPAGAETVYPGSDKKYRPIDVNYSSQYSPVTKWSVERTRIIPNLVGYSTQVKTLKEYREITNRYGSYTKGEHFPATGRFYVKKSGNRFWFVDPEGYPLYMRGVNSFVQSPEKKFSDSNATFVSHFQKELGDMGIHAVSAFATSTYADVNAHNAMNQDNPLPQAPSFGFLGAFKNAKGLNYPDGNSDYRVGLVFCAGWEDFCVNYMTGSTVGPFLRNKNVFGFYSDNEINFSSHSTKILSSLLKDRNHPAGQAAEQFMKEKGATSVTSELNLEFAGIIADKYYSAIRKAVDKVDPDLLYLGSRLHGTPKYMETVVEAAGKYCDVISVNYYSRWTPEPEFISNLEKWAPNTPFLVTEFYTKSDDDNDCKNNSGAGFMVKTQEDRAYAYQHFTLGLLEANNCIGWTWFRFQDDSCNKGLYKLNYEPYPYLQTAVRQVNYNVYDLIQFFQGNK